MLGLARATLDGNTLEVDVVASGPTPGRPRPFHLHVQVHGLFLPATEGEGTGRGEVNGTAGYKATLPVANGILLPVTDAQAARDLVALGGSLEGVAALPPSPVDWEAIAAQAVANYEATGQWYL